MVQPLVLHGGLPAGKASNQGSGHRCLPRLPGLLAVGQHQLRAINPLTEAILKRIVLLAFLDMASDSVADDFRDWLTIDSCDHVQFLCLVGRQANCHCLDSLHSRILEIGVLVVNKVGIMVSCHTDS